MLLFWIFFIFKSAVIIFEEELESGEGAKMLEMIHIFHFHLDILNKRIG